MEIIVSKKKSVLLFDAGYLFFYRYHATMKYLKFQYDDPPSDVVSAAFLDHLQKQIIKTIKKFKADIVIFCMDTPLLNIWRTKLFPDYKGKRENNIPIILDIRNEMHAIMDRFGIRMKHEHLEADDIAFLCVKNISNLYPDISINIITSDNDFLQMLTYNNVKIFNGGLKEKTGDPITELLLKILIGDKSDNIKGLCGKQRALKLINDEEMLQEFLQKKENQSIFDLNRKLIDMNNIPAKYQTEFLKSYKFI